MASYDIVIRNGKVISGTGSPWFYADVGVRNGKIVEVGYIKNPQADMVIDASGKFVSPGFIDVHNHSDLSLIAYPDATSALLQGVTTVIIGNCGFSAAPAPNNVKHVLSKYWSAICPVSVEIAWSGFDEYLNYLERVRPAVNVASLVGHGTLRIASMGFDSRAPSDDEMEVMKSLLRNSMEAGAFGISTGLIYAPGVYSQPNEVVELARVVSEYGGVYSTHVRSESYKLLQAIEEALDVGRRARAPIQISHLKAAGRDNWGKVKEVLKILTDAREGGIDVLCDVYPYTAGMTMLSATLPKWAHEGGLDALLSRLKDLDTRRKIREFIESEITSWENAIKIAGWDGIVIAYSERCKECEGKSLMELSRMWGLDPYDTLFNILLLDEAKSLMILHMMSEEDVIDVLGSPLSMIGSDSLILPPRFRVHPRFYGTFPRVIRRYVKELKILNLEDAIRKMTSLPAERFRISDRGIIAPNFKADIVLFDLEKIMDKASYEEPTQPPEGIEYVIVNGVISVEDGQTTGVRSGEVLRRNKLS